MELTEKWQSVWNKATWVVMILAVVFMCNTQPSQAASLEATTKIAPKYKNDNVRKYHKANKKRFQCTACPKKKFLGIFNRK